MDNYIGEVKIASFNFAPKGWAFCNGQLLQINQNQALFAVIGAVYGGDGLTTFALPDLRGRAALGYGTNHPIANPTGTQTQALTLQQLPAHNHTLAVNDATGNTPAPAGSYFADTGAGDTEYTTQAPNTIMSPSFLAQAGAGQPISVMQPYLALNFIIALQGLYPSRS